ncbi:MAG TPA: hypothetical protein VF132_10370, partial [Rudaea sp.]
MRFIAYLRVLIVFGAFAAASFAQAGTPIFVGITSMDDAYNFVASAVGSHKPVTITLNYSGNGNPSFDTASLDAIGLQGVNAPDFQILPSSTCVAGSTRLSSDGPASCTIVVQYTPS